MSDSSEHARLFASADPETVRCPYPAYAHLRQDHPVQWLEGLQAYAVTRYEDVLDVLRRPEEFSSARQSGPGAATNLARRVKDDPSFSEEVRNLASRRFGIAASSPVLVNADPPIHTRQRRLLNRAFSPRRVAVLQPSIQELTDRLVDGFASDGRADIVTQLAMPLPMTVIARALGIDHVDLGTLKRWSDSFVKANGNPHLSEEEIAALFRDMNDCYDAFTEALESRRESPRDDLISDVAHAQLDGEELTPNEQLQITTLFLIGGNETTTSLIASAVLAVLRDRPLRDKLASDPALVPVFVEEVLRLEPPVQGLFRIACSDVEVGGTHIPKDSFLWLVYASCNRDETVFSDAEELSWERADSRPHMSFGGGPHFCMGSNLARAEARIALETLLRRLPDIKLAPGEVGDQYYPNLVQHALTRLDVRFTPA